ncbi:hypothetical protein GWI33_008326 [Rhynchophorus ferrugineus]|uniref:C2H2-type domain-containing protein n=1 Tax=Rhynchophorus ferrugineus TaxID=354439 RepID=A0A834IVT6_RHYFE|nr:hypothetical protein GWI33_008326 [Rhynchophorus ferrugineus]
MITSEYFERSGLETSLKQENYEFPTENHHQNQYNYGDLSGPNSSTINKILENEIEFQKPLNDVNDMKIDLNTIYSIIKQDSNVVTNKIKQKPDALESSTEDERRTNVTGNDKNPEKDPPPVELEEPMECEVCNKTYNNNVAFVLHSVDHHQDNKYYCYLCGYKTMSKYLIEKHIRTHEGTADYICEICNKTFTISTHAKEHKYFHSGKKPFPCNICGNKFMFSWLLRSHKRLRHWEIVNGSPLMNYTCVTCNANYTCSSALKPHNITHHGPDVICDICDKSIKKNQLQIHQRIHIREKPYSCQYCDKYFTQKSSVTLHERIHTGEKSYNCEICQKAFNTKGSRDRHMKTCKKEPK